MASVSNWMHVDYFTLDQAAALWCGFDPSMVHIYSTMNPPEFLAAKQMLESAILSGLIEAEFTTELRRTIRDFSKSCLHRANLESFARSKSVYPAFLFDTLAPIEDQTKNSFDRSPTPLQVSATQLEKPVANRGGRPAQYDWDSFTMEIIGKANRPDGLPETQAELMRQMLDWFSITYGSEPAESSVKLRISKIYNYLQKAKNLTD